MPWQCHDDSSSKQPLQPPSQGSIAMLHHHAVISDDIDVLTHGNPAASQPQLRMCDHRMLRLGIALHAPPTLVHHHATARRETGEGKQLWDWNLT